VAARPPESTPKTWFYGRFSPAPRLPFQVPRAVSIADRYAVNLMADAFWITTLARPEGISFDAAMDGAERLASAIAGAYALKTGIGMRPFVEAWVESESAVHAATLGVRRAEELAAPAELAIQHQALGAVDYAVRASDAWVEAMRDVGLATVDHTDDAFLFAARSLESCARAVSGRKGSITGGDWDRLAECMGVTPEELANAKDPLSGARAAVAHGDREDPNLQTARANREDLLNLARGLVRLAIQRAQTEAVRTGTWVLPPGIAPSP
jgi:hypothetical protein